MCWPSVNNTPAHLGLLASVAIVTVDGVQAAACSDSKQTVYTCAAGMVPMLNEVINNCYSND